jgi:hypothetical protein
MDEVAAEFRSARRADDDEDRALIARHSLGGEGGKGGEEEQENH